MKTFTIEATLEGASYTAKLECSKIDQALSKWAEALTEQPEPDYRSASKEVVIEAMKKDHHMQPAGAEIVGLSLLWLLANGPLGTRAMPYVRAGDMTVTFEITNVGGKTYNFRTKFDEKTDRSMVL